MALPFDRHARLTGLDWQERLFVCLILNALGDAADPHHPLRAEHARQWLDGSADFQWWCASVGVAPDRLQRQLTAALQRARAPD